MRQKCIIPSGAQQWMKRVFASNSGRFAYCSTLAIYLYRLRGYQLEKILVGHDKMITGICWSPFDPRLLASTSTDQVLKVWDVDREEVVCELSSVGFNPSAIYWTLHDQYTVLVFSGGAVRAWNIRTNTVKPYNWTRDSNPAITSFSICRRDVLKLAFGTEQGTVYTANLASNAVKSWSASSDNAVIEVAWDPRSDNYLLIGTNDGKIALVDADTQQEMTVFARHSGGLRALSWVPEVPGGFITVSDRSGVIRMWNVSQNGPTELLKTGKDGFHSVRFIASDAMLCAFKDGMVSVYNFKRKQVDWSTQGGHTETIFDCAFQTSDPNILATASYDSTVRLWDIRSSKCTGKLMGATGVLYAVTWSPDGTQLAACSSEGKLFIYDIDKGMVVRTMAHHSQAVYRCAWNQKDPSLIAAASADTTVTVSRVTSGSVQRTLRHPQAVFGCDWGHFDPNLLATACQDGGVYVWNVAQAQQLICLKGHTAKVFNVAWSKLVPDTILSGSDDCTARVWNVRSQSCTVLKGHTMNVRGLLWNSEVPWLAVTGSWDATIRTWDTRSGATLAVVRDHHADVYGVSMHPARPFVIATASRDTTVRIWSLDKDFNSLKIGALLGEQFTGSLDTSGVLAGAGSAALAKRLTESPGKRVEQYGAVFDYFTMPAGTAELWRLAGLTLGGINQTKASHILVPHQSEVGLYLNAQALDLEAQVGASKKSFIGAGQKETMLNKAAMVYLKLGNLEKYCELMVQLGEWEKAIAIAPAVGLDLWSRLVQQYAREKLAANASTLTESLPWYIAINQAEVLVNMFITSEQYAEAFTLAQVSSAGGFADLTLARGMQLSPKKKPSPSSAAAANRIAAGQVHHIRSRMADAHAVKGEAVWAACCHLSVDDVHLALSKLLKGNELELAAGLGWATNTAGADRCTYLLARQCEAAGLWDRAALVIQQAADGDERTLQSQLSVLRRCMHMSQSGPIDAPKLYAEAGLQPPDAYARTAREQEDPAGMALHYLLAQQPEKAVDIGLQFLKSVLSCSSWSMADVEPMADVLACVHVPALGSPQREELQAYTVYIASQRAIAEGYFPIVPFLMERVRTLVRTHEIDFPIKIALLSLQELSIQQYIDPAEAHRGLEEISATEWVPEDLRQVASTLASSSGADVHLAGLNENVVIPTAASMPSGGTRSNRQTCMIADKQVSGPVHMLEDGNTGMALGDAVMWFRVCPISPLNTAGWSTVA